MEDRIFEIFKERYNSEFERQHKLRSNISIIISICTLIIAGLTFILKSLHLLNKDPLSILCYSLTTVVYLLLLFSVWFLTLSIIGYTYGMLPSPSKTLEDIGKLKKHYDLDYFNNKSAEEKESLINAHILKFFKEYYVEATDINFANNNKKSKYLYLAQRTLLIAVIILLITLPLIFIKSITHLENVNLNIERLSMSTNEKKPEQKPIEKNPTLKPPPEPQKTPLEMVKESEDKPLERKKND